MEGRASFGGLRTGSASSSVPRRRGARSASPRSISVRDKDECGRAMIYLDYNATTPLCAAARDAMLPYLDRHFGNPSSVHAAGREARAAIDTGRDQLASLLHA